MNELTQKYRAKNGKAQFEIFAERDGCLYGRVCTTAPTNNWSSCKWKDGINSLSDYYDIEEIPATPEHGLKVDDLVWVWDLNKQDKRIACFAGFANNGLIETWCYGQTSTGCSAKNTWQHWEKYQPEPVQTSEPATPKWHEYLNQGYAILCHLVDNDATNTITSDGFVSSINLKKDLQYPYISYFNGIDYGWENAEPIPTQCGKYCTAVKDGKTMLLLLE